MGNKNNPRTQGFPPHIIREHSFDSQLEKIAKNYSRLDELDMAIDWGLAHNPTAFYRLDDGYHLWKLESISPAFPQLRILYHYDADKNTVTLVAVEEV